MIRGSGNEMFSAYSQTFNRYEVAVAYVNRDCESEL